MNEVICDYCGEPAEFVDSKVIYGKSYGMVYLCKCVQSWAYVGVHKNSNKPLGRLADKDLRKAKNQAHAAFDPIWKDEHMTRSKAYKWLADKLGIESAGRDCHIGMFDVDKCLDVVRVCNEYFEVNK